MNIKLTAPVSGQITFSSSLAENNLLNRNMAGYIGEAYDFTMSGSFTEAELTFTFDQSLLEQEGFVPAIYYFNEDSQLLEEVEHQSIQGNTVTAQLEHFSTYVLLNKTEFDLVWKNDIKKPGTENQTAKNLTIAFVIDTSGSMSGTRISTVKTVMNEFINSLGENDRAAVIRYASSASLQQELTSDKEKLTAAVNSLGASGGTSIKSGVDLGITQLTDDTANDSYDTLILLTDGQDSSFNSQWSTCAETCVNNQITVYSVGIGYGVSSGHLTSFAEATGGKYYKADVVSDLKNQFEEIKGETIDYTTDSNHDGISDYYTKLLCEGKLTTSSGERLFATKTYEAVQSGDDCDGDGLKNGEEIKIVSSGDQVYAKVISYPDTAYSDADIFSDKEEHDNETDPLKSNGIFFKSDINYLTDNDNYVSEKYRDLYNSKVLGALEKGSIWIGSNIFGSDHDSVYTYKSFLVSCFDSMYAGYLKKNEIEETASLIFECFKDMQQSVTAASTTINGVGDANLSSKISYLDNLYQQLDTSKKELSRMLNSGYDPGTMSRDRFYELFDDSLNDYRKASAEIPELEKNIKYSGKLKTVGKAADVVGFVLDIYDAYKNVKETWNTYTTFAASMDMISENVYILDEISSNTSDKKLKSACNELRKALKV